uniref:FAM21/CAPZIP domain-containing protein n=1 Tax=Ciona intestinalis TaxID=7719 RepID=F6X2T3_CIOIN
MANDGASGGVDSQTATSEIKSTNEDKILSFNDLRQHADHWSLGSDAELLEQLQQFASRLTTRAHQMSRDVSQLIHDTRLTDAKIESVTDYFLTLSDHQFIENRVYDEDTTSAKQETNNDEKAAKTKEEREADMMMKLKESVNFGIKVIDESFDILDMKVEDSDVDSDDEDDIVPDEILLEAKDPYVHRPLPHLIGSRSFYQEDDVGIGDLMASDVESEVGSVSESEDEIEEAVVVSDSSSSSDYPSSEDGSVDESEDDEIAPKRTAPPSDSLSSSDESEDLFDEQSDDSDQVITKQKPSKKASKPRKPSNEMFGGEAPEDDLFATSSGGLFGSGKGLFDAPKSGGLFDDVEIEEDEEEDDVKDHDDDTDHESAD